LYLSHPALYAASQVPTPGGPLPTVAVSRAVNTAVGWLRDDLGICESALEPPAEPAVGDDGPRQPGYM